MVPYLYAGLTFVSLLAFYLLVLSRAGESVFDVAPEGVSTEHMSLSSKGTRRRAPAWTPPAPIRASKALPKEPREALTPEEEIFSLAMQKKVFVWLKKLGVPARAIRDVAQEAFAQAWRSFETYDAGKGRPERWLNGVCVNTVGDYMDLACSSERGADGRGASRGSGRTPERRGSVGRRGGQDEDC